MFESLSYDSIVKNSNTHELLGKFIDNRGLLKTCDSSFFAVNLSKNLVNKVAATSIAALSTCEYIARLVVSATAYIFSVLTASLNYAGCKCSLLDEDGRLNRWSDNIFNFAKDLAKDSSQTATVIQEAVKLVLFGFKEDVYSLQSESSFTNISSSGNDSPYSPKSPTLPTLEESYKPLEQDEIKTQQREEPKTQPKKTSVRDRAKQFEDKFKNVSKEVQADSKPDSSESHEGLGTEELFHE